MARARATVQVEEDSPLPERVVHGSRGPCCGWVDVGEFGALGVWGSPAALRRFGAAVLAAAETAEQADEFGGVAGQLRPLAGATGTG